MCTISGGCPDPESATTDKRERNGKSGLTPDKTKRPSVGGAQTGPAPPLGPAGGGHDDAESAADRFG